MFQVIWCGKLCLLNIMDKKIVFEIFIIQWLGYDTGNQEYIIIINYIFWSFLID